MISIQNYIGGKLQNPESQSWFPNVEPATGEVFSQVPDSDFRDVQSAYLAAKEAFPAWSRLPSDQREKWLQKMAEGIERRTEEFAMAESLDNGKPLALALSVDIPRAIQNFRFFASAAVQFASESHSIPGVAINYTLRNPIGVAGCISPWNLPIYLFSWKIAPALASGCTVVAKPSELTPYTAYLLSQVCIDIGLPAGVLNIVHGYGHKVGQAIVEHSGIKAISFTGGTVTGKKIVSTAGPMFKKLSLELGGKNPTIVFADCDFEKTIRETARAAFSNQGEICLCGSRIYVERSIYEKYRNAFVTEVNMLKVGDPLLQETSMGALVSKEHLLKVKGYISLAQEEGGVLLTGGEQIFPEGRCNKGYFLLPTVLEGLAPGCRTQQEEIFGPVVTLTPFDSEDEVIELANGVEYGLSANVWTTNLNCAHRVAEKLDCGIVWINCWLLRDLRTPFGGTKSSGTGREGGWEALRFFTEPKNVCIKY